MKTKLLAGMILVALVLCVPAAWAQQKDPRVNPPASPIPPLSTEESSSRTTAVDAPATAPEPPPPANDQRPVTSVEPPSLGILSGGRSFLLPSLRLFQGGSTNAFGGPGNSGVAFMTTFSGGLAFQHVARRQQVSAEYTGGGQFQTVNNNLNSSFHRLGLTYRAGLGRWSLALIDHMQFANEAGFGGIGGAGSPFRLGGVGAYAGNLNQLLVPSQSIYTNRGARISNTFTGEVQYAASRRSSLTVSGSYGLLHFLDPGFVDNRSTSFQVGYNRVLTAADSLGLSYGLNMLRFGGTDDRVNNHNIHLTYGRQLTGRLALQIGAGPQINAFSNTVNGSDTVLSWSLQSSLLYKAQPGNLSVSYNYGVTGGSGVFLGARTHAVQLAFNRQLSRMWSGGVFTGYAHNSQLAQTAITTAGRSFNTWYTRASVNRPLGRYTGLSLHYGLERQTGLPGAVVNFRHTFGIAFSFRFQPIDLE